MAAALAAGLTVRAEAQTPAPDAVRRRDLVLPDPAETIDLWPGTAPGAPGALPVERVEERSEDPGFNDRFVGSIARPRMVVFRAERPDGSAALVIPGGGYERTVIDKEGYETARALAARGTTAFVLFYRLPHQGWMPRGDAPLADAQRAMRLIRRNAVRYAIDPARILAIGFSAGGHLCAELTTRFDASVYEPLDERDALPARPGASALIYPVIAMSPPHAHRGSQRNLLGNDPTAERVRTHSPHLNVAPGGPAVFLLHAEDDATVPVENSLMMRDALKAGGIPVETHLFPDGGHGFGIRMSKGRSVEGWEHLLFAWGKRQRIFG